MTDQDNLRDRIADAINRADSKQDILGDQYGAAPDLEAIAQAVIDEFELTTETHAATHAKRTMTRTIGAWEWEKQ